jgi:hypothetical protein
MSGKCALRRIPETLERSWCRCENDIKIELKVTECNGVDSNHMLQCKNQ